MILVLNDSPEYLNRVHSWWYSQWEHEWATETIESVGREQFPILYGWVEHDVICGVVMLCRNCVDDKVDLEFWLDGLYVDPSYRGKGISTRLIEHCVNEAKGFGISVLNLLAHAPYDACEMYKRYGWTHISDHYYYGETIRLMKKEL